MFKDPMDFSLHGSLSDVSDFEVNLVRNHMDSYRFTCLGEWVCLLLLYEFHLACWFVTMMKNSCYNFPGWTTSMKWSCAVFKHFWRNFFFLAWVESAEMLNFIFFFFAIFLLDLFIHSFPFLVGFWWNISMIHNDGFDVIYW